MAVEKMAEKQDRLLRLPDIIGDSNAVPPILARIPVSRSTWWAGVASGRFPKPIRFGRRITCWRESDIQNIIDGKGVDSGPMLFL